MPFALLRVYSPNDSFSFSTSEKSMLEQALSELSEVGVDVFFMSTPPCQMAPKPQLQSASSVNQVSRSSRRRTTFSVMDSTSSWNERDHIVWVRNRNRRLSQKITPVKWQSNKRLRRVHESIFKIASGATNDFSSYLTYVHCTPNVEPSTLWNAIWKYHNVNYKTPLSLLVITEQSEHEHYSATLSCFFISSTWRSQSHNYIVDLRQFYQKVFFLWLI